MDNFKLRQLEIVDDTDQSGRNMVFKILYPKNKYIIYMDGIQMKIALVRIMPLLGSRPALRLVN